tara:strand:- start:82 stop:261 length:180 start_codon:yes stop_codon:yes gene_type:complete
MATKIIELVNNDSNWHRFKSEVTTKVDHKTNGVVAKMVGTYLSLAGGILRKTKNNLPKT